MRGKTREGHPSPLLYLWANTAKKVRGERQDVRRPPRHLFGSPLNGLPPVVPRSCFCIFELAVASCTLLAFCVFVPFVAPISPLNWLSPVVPCFSFVHVHFIYCCFCSAAYVGSLTVYSLSKSNLIFIVLVLLAQLLCNSSKVHRTLVSADEMISTLFSEK